MGNKNKKDVKYTMRWSNIYLIKSLIRRGKREWVIKIISEGTLSENCSEIMKEATDSEVKRNPSRIIFFTLQSDIS